MNLRRRIRWLTWVGLIGCLLAAVPALYLLYHGLAGERERLVQGVADSAGGALRDLHGEAARGVLSEEEALQRAQLLIRSVAAGPVRLALFTDGRVPPGWPGDAGAFVGLARIEPAGWVVAAADTRADLNRVFLGESLAFLVFLGVLLILSWPLSNHLSAAVVGRIEGLSAGMKALTEGRTDIVVPDQDRADELGAMARALEFFRRAASVLLEREKRLSGIMANVGEAIVLVSADGVVEEGNPAAIRIFGADPTGRRMVELFTATDRPQIGALLARLAAAAPDDAALRAEALGVDRGGERVDVSLALSRLEVGDRRSVIAVLADVTERLRHERELVALATRDRLTGLPNRTLIETMLEAAVDRAAREGRTLSVLCLDLSRFKLVTDTMGHRAGDLLLLDVALRLQGFLAPGDTLGRVGSDDFAILLESTAAEAVAERILAAFDAPLVLMGNEVYARPSIGIAAYPVHGEDAAELLRAADTALYAAKRQGGRQYAFFNTEMGDRARRHLSLDRDLRQALAGGQFRLHYQPKVSLIDFSLEGFEALLRWEKPGHGQVLPGEFIPVAEDSGFIVPLGDWVLDEVCRQQREWLDQGAEPVPVAVNISPRQLRQRTAEAFNGALVRHGVPPSLIELEITESGVMQDLDHALVVLGDLKAMGIRVAVDDFGTGHSSLAYLKRLPVSTLKIDRSFIDGIPQTREDAGIVSTIIDMAEMLGLSVVAEGVERPEQAHFLRHHNCMVVQGWLTGRPVSADSATDLLFQRQRQRA